MATKAASGAPVIEQGEAGDSRNGMAASGVASRAIGAAASHSHYRWLLVARSAWVGLAILTVTMFLASLPTRYMQLLNYSGDVRVGLNLAAIDPAQLTTSRQFYAGYNLGLEIVYALIFFTVALFIFWRMHNDRIALLASLALLTFGATSIPTIWPLVDEEPAWFVPAKALDIIGWFSIAALLFLFPDGRFAPRWTMWAFVLFAAHLPLTFFPSSPFYPEKLPLLHALLNVLAWGSGVFSLIYKYRHVLGPVQRQQTKWVVYGMVVGVLGALAATLPNMVDQVPGHFFHPGSLFHEVVHVPLLFSFLALIPLSIGVSIVHYRLWDIDVIINRTLVYLPLTGILAGLYSASMVLFQKLSVAITGEQSDAAVVLTTLVIASVFTPVKEKVQRVVDKSFKHLCDPARRLKAFNEQMELFIQMNDVVELTRHALNEVVGAYGARNATISLYLDRDRRPNGRQRPGSQVRLVHTPGQHPNGDDADHIYQADDGDKGDEGGNREWMCVPLRSGGIEVGLLRLGPRLDRSEYSSQDRENLQRTVDLLGRTLPLAERTAALRRPPLQKEG